MFKLADSDGYRYNSYIMGGETRGAVDGVLQPNAMMRGEVGFQVPESSQGFQLVFEPETSGFSQVLVNLY